MAVQKPQAACPGLIEEVKRRVGPLDSIQLRRLFGGAASDAICSLAMVDTVGLDWA